MGAPYAVARLIVRTHVWQRNMVADAWANAPVAVIQIGLYAVMISRWGYGLYGRFSESNTVITPRLLWVKSRN